MLSFSSIKQIFYQLVKKIRQKLSGAQKVCPDKLSRTENKLSENSVCVWITHKKLLYSSERIFCIKTASLFIQYKNSIFIYTPQLTVVLFIGSYFQILSNKSLFTSYACENYLNSSDILIMQKIL